MVSLTALGPRSMSGALEEARMTIKSGVKAGTEGKGWIPANFSAAK
jgi:hypothetical protein